MASHTKTYLTGFPVYIGRTGGLRQRPMTGLRQRPIAGSPQRPIAGSPQRPIAELPHPFTASASSWRAAFGGKG
jgi:hypothetical protein